MIFSFLTEDNIGKKYNLAKDYTKQLTSNFDEYERIARNRPKNNIPSHLPKTTDGTASSIIRKTPKRVVQQLPTGAIEAVDDDDWKAIVAEFVYTNEILPYANEEYDLVQKCWNTLEHGLTFGNQGVYTPFLNHGGHFSTDMVLPYWGDLFIQPGKKSGYACNYVFMRSWWQPEDIEAVIKAEEKTKSEAKKRGDEYTPTWDLEALKEIKDKTVAKDAMGLTPNEEEKGTDNDAVEIVTGFQTGVGATFYTFYPGGDDGGVKILRRKKNKDPRGKMPIDWFYADIDGTSALGRGILDLIGPLQDLIDTNMQTFEFNRLLAMRPPLIKRGNFSKRKIVYQPDVIIDLGDDPNADISPLNVDTTAVTGYPELYGLKKSQMLNLVASPDTSISAEVGNPGFGKTPTALKQQENMVSVDDNYLRKMFEAFFENWSETAVNLFFAERSGIDELKLDDRTADKLRKLADEGKFDARQIAEDNTLLINYDDFTVEFKFRVDASTSKMKDDNKQGEILTNLLTGLESSQILAQTIPTDKVLAMWNRLVTTSGVEDPEDMTIDIDEFMKQQQEAAMQQQMQDQMAMEQQALPSGEIDPSQIPEGEVMQEPMPEPLPPETPQIEEQDPISMIYQMILDQGYPVELAVEGADMASQGASPEEVFATLNGAIANAAG